MLDECLVAHCSPTLANLKVANMVNLPMSELLWEEAKALNRRLIGKGVRLMPLRERDGKVLLLVYRREALQQVLDTAEVQAFLSHFGYHRFTVSAALSVLRRRLAQCCDFPHEIGVFLGYPLADVIAFVEDRHQPCQCVGCWRCYHNVEEAKRTFARYQKCQEIYLRLFALGKTIDNLTVKTV